jgi:hypothetical protein
MTEARLGWQRASAIRSIFTRSRTELRHRQAMMIAAASRANYPRDWLDYPLV